MIIYRVVIIGLLLRIGIAFWNTFLGSSFGADSDAQQFNLTALNIAYEGQVPDFAIGTMPYLSFLAFFYWLLTDSLLIGCLLSCFIWLISSAVLIKTMRLLSINERNIFLAVTIYAFLPSSIMYTSVTLREAYQLFFVNVAIYSALTIFIKKSSLHWLLLGIGCFGASILHGGLMAFCIVLFALTLFFWVIRNKREIPWAKIVMASPVIITILFIGLTIFTQNAYQLDDGFSSSVESYQTGGIAADGRTNYKDDSSITGVLGLILFIPVSFFQYLFEPMPWKISALADVPVFFENILRGWLIWTTIKGFRTMPLNKYRPVLFVFIAYFSLEIIWSLGTVNWGTASRHHIPSMGMLLLAAFANRRIIRKQ
jgi:hypothetical protein